VGVAASNVCVAVRARVGARVGAGGAVTVSVAAPDGLNVGVVDGATGGTPGAEVEIQAQALIATTIPNNAMRIREGFIDIYRHDQTNVGQYSAAEGAQYATPAAPSANTYGSTLTSEIGAG